MVAASLIIVALTGQVRIQDEATPLGLVNVLRCSGTGVTCTKDASTGIISVADSGVITCPAGKFLSAAGTCTYPELSVATGQISTTQITNASVITAKLADGAVDGNKIASASITATHLNSASSGFGLTVAGMTSLITGPGYTTSGTGAATLPFDSIKLDTVTGFVSGSTSQYTPQYKGVYEVSANLTGKASAAATKLTVEVMFGTTVVDKVENTFDGTNSQTVNIRSLVNVGSLGNALFIRVTCETVGQTVNFPSQRSSMSVSRVGIQ